MWKIYKLETGFKYKSYSPDKHSQDWCDDKKEEDFWILVLGDGVSSAQETSSIALSYIKENKIRYLEDIYKILNKINKELKEKESEFRGTTIIILLIEKKEKKYKMKYVYIGDSYLYKINIKKMREVFKDWENFEKNLEEIFDKDIASILTLEHTELGREVLLKGMRNVYLHEDSIVNPEFILGHPERKDDIISEIKSVFKEPSGEENIEEDYIYIGTSDGLVEYLSEDLPHGGYIKRYDISHAKVIEKMSSVIFQFDDIEDIVNNLVLLGSGKLYTYYCSKEDKFGIVIGEKKEDKKDNIKENKRNNNIEYKILEEYEEFRVDNIKKEVIVQNFKTSEIKMKERIGECPICGFSVEDNHFRLYGVDVNNNASRDDVSIIAVRCKVEDRGKLVKKVASLCMILFIVFLFIYHYLYIVKYSKILKNIKVKLEEDIRRVDKLDIKGDFLIEFFKKIKKIKRKEEFKEELKRLEKIISEKITQIKELLDITGESFYYEKEQKLLYLMRILKTFKYLKEGEYKKIDNKVREILKKKYNLEIFNKEKREKLIKTVVTLTYLNIRKDFKTIKIEGKKYNIEGIFINDNIKFEIDNSFKINKKEEINFNKLIEYIRLVGRLKRNYDKEVESYKKELIKIEENINQEIFKISYIFVFENKYFEEEYSKTIFNSLICEKDKIKNECRKKCLEKYYNEYKKYLLEKYKNILYPFNFNATIEKEGITKFIERLRNYIEIEK